MESEEDFYVVEFRGPVEEFEQPVAAYEEWNNDEPAAIPLPEDDLMDVELVEPLEQENNRVADENINEQPVEQNVNDWEEIDSSSTCIICYSPYTNSGEHRLSCLKCGHPFGKSCIQHWLKTACPANGRKCPTCNVKAHWRDIRVLYAKTLIALDTTEKDRLIEQLNSVEEDKNRFESLWKQSQSKIYMLQEQVKTLENNIKELYENPRLKEKTDAVSKSGSLTMQILSSFKLSDKGCRVLASSEHLSLLLASQESTNHLFPGFGIRKINTYDMKAAPYQNNLHKKEIRDMAFSSHDRGTLLSVSLDCTAKIFDVQSNVAIHTVTVPEPLWSCSWNSLDSNKFLCGSQKSTIFVFDRRYLTAEPEKIIKLPDSQTGILSLCQIPTRAGRFMPSGGILACRLNCVTAVHRINDEIESTVLPIEGNFLSMRYDHVTDNVLISTRPSKNYAAPRHIVGQLSKSVPGDLKNGVIDVIHTFHGTRSPNVLCRSALFSCTNNDQIVCAYNERNSTLDGWSLMTDTKLDTSNIYLPDPVLDICAFRNQDHVIVPCLSESKLSVVKLSCSS